MTTALRGKSRVRVIRDSKIAVRGLAGRRFCIHDGTCTRKVNARGLCRSHVQAAYRLIRSGAVTEEQLVRAGRMLPLRRAAKEWFLEGVL
jgi:hypothetical protein